VVNQAEEIQNPIIHPIRCGLSFAYLIETRRGLFLVDSGSPDEEYQVIALMRRLKRTDLQLIWITHAHYDHYGSAGALRSLTGAQIGIHTADAESMATGFSPLGTTHSYGFIYPMAQKVLSRLHPLPPTPPDFTLVDGGSLMPWGLHARILHSPGHTPGASCLILEPGIAFAGDLLGGVPRPGLQRLLATDWDQLPASLAKLQAVQPEKVYLGHSALPVNGKVIRGIKARTT